MIRLLTIVFFLGTQLYAQQSSVLNVGPGWANNSVNTTVYRKNSLVSFGQYQYIAYYDSTSHMVLGKRNLHDTVWQLRQTTYTGNTSDAHNVISIMVDGEGFLHVAWDHHNNPLNYCRSVAPGSLELTAKIPMTRSKENMVSYPEFYNLPNGNILFFYRDGGSGRGDLVINKYSIATRQWVQLHSNLIDGQGKRNAYWQACTDARGTIHISWVWRESPDVASNHDMCYARSTDGGLTWQQSNGTNYTLPITAVTAEYALRIAQNSELINQTSMSTDTRGNPVIATYWRDSGSAIPQYHLVYRFGGAWQTTALQFRKTPFSLSGVGSKRIPIARPQVIVNGSGKKASAFLIFRDEERGSRVSVAALRRLAKASCKIFDLTPGAVGSWEPSFDTELWKNEKILDLFVQKVEQVDGEGMANIPPQMVQVLRWKPGNN